MRRETGSTTPLIIGFTMIVLLAAVVVIDASAAWLQRQSLNNLADAAALHAANESARGTEVYSGGLQETLRLDQRVARRAVGEFLSAADGGDQAGSLSYTVGVDEGRVRVVVRARLRLPLTLPGIGRGATVSGHGAALVRLDPR